MTRSAENEAVHASYRQLVADLFADPDATPYDFKRIYEAFLADLEVPDDATFEQVDAGGVPAIWATAPGATAERTIVHFHSGGYVIGSAHGYRGFGARLSAASGCRVLLVDYRLAPDHPFPAPVEDAQATWQWLRGQGIAAADLVVTGDSAGGGLALVLLQQLRDQHEELPACVMVMSPFADMACTGASLVENADADPLVSPDLAGAMAGMYLADTGTDPKDPRVSPLYGDFGGLPPMLVMVGDIEGLRDDARRCAAKARDAGVEVDFREEHDMVHVWPIFADRLKEAREAIELAGRFARQRLGVQATA